MSKNQLSRDFRSVSIFDFIDHIPNSSLDWLTLRHYGFSDASEVFVFVSGYTCMLAYGGALREQGWPTTIVRALRRGWEIYAAFLLLLIAYFALVWLVGGGDRYLDETNTGYSSRVPVRLSSTPPACSMHPSIPTYCLPLCSCIWPFQAFFGL